MSGARISWGRIAAVLIKEFIQLRRDRLTFGMMIGIPIMQLVLFGFAINTDPRHLPTALILAENSAFTRSIVAGMANSDYFRIIETVSSEAAAQRLLARGEVAFVVAVPPSFGRDLVRGQKPQILLEADATDPAAASNAVGAFGQIVQSALRNDLEGALRDLAYQPPPVEVVVHRRYNPEAITRYNIVPGLLGVILTMTMTLFTAVAITRERERGNLELLITTPIRTPELMVGKILPYVGIGLIQATLILSVGWLLFRVPVRGSLLDLGAVCLAFICAALTLGLLISTLAQTQFQAFQLTFFSFLPQILLSGFMFPFDGMPRPAQWLAQIFPLTHMLRLVRGILLRGAGIGELWPSLWPLGVFFLVTATLAITRFHKRLA